MEKIVIESSNNNEVERIAYKYSIKNHFEHGKADVGAVVGKVKAIFPKAIIGQIIPIIKKTVEQVNQLDKKRIEEDYNIFNESGWELKHIEKEKTLPELDWLKKGQEIITRVAPNPSGAMHFGHARPAILSDEFVRKYGGKLFIRFDDTDPKIKKPVDGIEEEFLKEFKWLGISVSGTSNASNNLKQYYKIIEILLAEEKAYICFCKPIEWRERIWKGEACPCREKNSREQLKNWKKMLKHELKEGSCVVRLKTDLNDKDSSTRDWWLAKIVDNVEHPNKKVLDNHVWPSYNFASAVDDHTMQINFIIRGQEHVQNEKKQRQLYDYFNWVYPHTKYHGKISQIGDMVLSKSKIKVLMEQQGLNRDDDPRLATLKSFRRRGFKPETIRQIVFELGLNINEAKISLENMASINKKFLGEIKNYPFIEEGIEIEINNFSKGKIIISEQEILIDGPIQKFIIDKKEMQKIKIGELVRFKDGFNARIEETSEFGAKAFFLGYEKTGYKTINWLKENVEVRILMSNGKEKIGLSTPILMKEKEGQVIYFNNIGYARIEDKEKMYFVFSHE